MGMELDNDRLLRALRDPRVRALLCEEADPEPEPDDDAAAIFDDIDAEDARAEALCDSLLTGPSSRWPERVYGTPATRTAGMVRELLRRMPALLERRPADALQVTSMAMKISEWLRAKDYWIDHVIILRAQALRDHAYVLSFLGRYQESLQYVAKAERTYEAVPGEDFDLARLALVKACTLRRLHRCEEAIALTRQAAETFLAYDDRPRYVNARITEAAMLYHGGTVERALEVWSSLRGDPGLDAVGELRLAHNVGMCLHDLGRHAEAVGPLERCVAEFARLGLATERTRSRSYLGNALLGTARSGEAVAVLRLARQEFAELGLPVDAALTALDLAEALVASGQPAEVPAICREAIAVLTDAGLARQAIPALTLLRETAAAGGASRELIRRTHARVGQVARREAFVREKLRMRAMGGM